jgi:hypothetical protein
MPFASRLTAIAGELTKRTAQANRLFAIVAIMYSARRSGNAIHTFSYKGELMVNDSGKTRSRHVRRAAAVMAALLIVASCGDDDDDSAEESAPAETDALLQPTHLQPTQHGRNRRRCN